MGGGFGAEFCGEEGGVVAGGDFCVVGYGFFWFDFLFDWRECKRGAIVCGMGQILRFMKKTKIVCNCLL